MTQVCGRTATTEPSISETRRSSLANPTSARQTKVKKQRRAADRATESRAVSRVCDALNRRTNVECRVSSSPDELFAAFRLVYEQYQRSGLMNPNKCGLRITPYHLLPTTEVLVALERRQVTCTMSLVCDSDNGLPMEAVYPEEIAGLRLKELSWPRFHALPRAKTIARARNLPYFSLCRSWPSLPIVAGPMCY